MTFEKRTWLQQLNNYYNPAKGHFQAGIFRLTGGISDQFYYAPAYPEIELPQLLAQHFQDKSDLFAWYQWGEGLRYEFDRVTGDDGSADDAPPAAQPARRGRLDPGAALGRARQRDREQRGRVGGSRFAQNAADALREIDELLRGRRDRNIVFLLHDVSWELDSQLIPMVRQWPHICLGNHLVIVSARKMPAWVEQNLGDFVTSATIGGPTSDEIKARLIQAQLTENEQIFDWEVLDELAGRLAERSSRGGYRKFVVQMIRNRRNMLYDKNYVKRLGSADSTTIDYKQIDIAAFEQYLNDNLIGQDAAKRWALQEVSRLQKRGVPRKRKQPQPIIRKLFAGPSGVGKTEIAKIISRFVFNREPLLIPCNQYAQGHETAKLLGAPPGYVGYGEPGLITQYLQEAPHGVIILDEFEKGADEVQKFFMNILEEGKTTTPSNHVINFGHTIVIATSNAGSEQADEHPQADSYSVAQREQIYESAIRQEFNQALLGRLTGYLIFSMFSDAERVAIARLYMDVFAKQMRQEYEATDFSVSATDAFYDALIARCHRNLGARKVREGVKIFVDFAYDAYAESNTTRPIILDFVAGQFMVGGRPQEVQL